MRVLKNIYQRNKLFLFFSSLKPGRRFIGYLFLCLFFPSLSSCVILWPLHAERDYSLIEDYEQDIIDIDRSYVINLFELNKSRYLDLKKAGGEYCLPGQMRIIKDQQQLILLEIYGNLLGDASNTLSESFRTLEMVRLMMEDMAEKDGCPLRYAAGLIQSKNKPFSAKDSVLGLPDWPRPVNLRTFMRGRNEEP